MTCGRRNEAGEGGFTLVEMLLAATLVCVVTGVLLQLAVVVQRTVVSQGELGDLQQRLRVAAAALERDLLMAGAGPSQGPANGPLALLIPPVLPARAGLRDADPELFHADDRITIVYVPDSASQTALAADMAGPGAPLAIDAAWPGCPAGGACGFADGNRALVFDPSGTGAYDIFTVAAPGGGLLSAASPLSRAYRAGSPVVAVVQRVYHLDAGTRRLMVYDGAQTDSPLVDHVAGLRFTYYAGDSGPGGALQPLTRAQLTSGPVGGSAPNRFDADLLRVRRIRVSMVIETPRRSTGLDARLRTRRIALDVAPRSMQAVR